MSAQAGRAAVAVLLSLEAAALTAVLAATAADGRWWPGLRLALADFILTGLAVFAIRDWRAHSPKHKGGTGGDRPLRPLAAQSARARGLQGLRAGPGRSGPADPEHGRG